MRRRSIRTRLTLWYASLLTATVLLLGGTAYGLLHYSLTHDVDTALRDVARVLAKPPLSSPQPLLPADIDAIFRQFFGFSPWDRYVERRQPVAERDPAPGSGRLPLSTQAVRRAAQGLSTFETLEGMGRYPVRVLTFPVVEAGRVGHLIQVGMSLESMLLVRRRFLLAMAAVLPLGLVLAGGGGWLLARRALQPVDQLAEAARRISAERPGERLRPTGSGDELDRLAPTLNDMLGRLDAAFQQVRQFSADACHELQTPLTILKGELEVALRAPRSPEEYRRVLRSALEESERLARLVDGLLLLARADAGALRLDRQPVALEPLVIEVVEQAQLLAAPHDVGLCLGALEPAVVPGDGEHLRRLLVNLPDNGIKYTPPGGRVTVSVQRAGDWAVLCVADTGIGLSPDEQARIFQRFYRAANTHLQGEGGPAWASASPSRSPRPMAGASRSRAAPAGAVPSPSSCPCRLDLHSPPPASGNPQPSTRDFAAAVRRPRVSPAYVEPCQACRGAAASGSAPTISRRPEEEDRDG